MSINCPPGSFLSGSFCIPCSDNSFKNFTGNSACLSCPPDYAANDDFTNCIPCPNNDCLWTYNSVIFAGNGTSATIDGPLSSALFNAPRSISLDDEENLYIAEWYGKSVRKIHVTTGYVSTLSGFPSLNYYYYGVLYKKQANGNFVYSGGNTIGNLLALSDRGLISSFKIDVVPHELASYDNETIILATNLGCTVCSFNVYTSSFNVIAGRSGICTGADGYGTSATFQTARSVATDRNGDIYVGEASGQIRKISNATTDRLVTTFANTFMNIGQHVDGISIDHVNDKMYVTGRNRGMVFRITKYGVPVTLANIQRPIGIKVDSKGNLFVSSAFQGIIYKIFACPPYSVWNSTSRECPCLPGYQNAEPNSCIACPDGSFKATIGTQKCTSCPIGQESSVDKMSCRNCVTGTLRPALSLDSCIPCPFNSECSSTAFNCAPGYTLNTTTSLSCQPCSSGYAKAIFGNHNCTQCPIGQQPNQNRTECVDCLADTFKPCTLEFDICIPCPVGARCSNTNMTCLAGYSLSTTKAYECDRCQDLYFKPNDGNFACDRCPESLYSTDDYTGCTACPYGNYLSSNGTCMRCGAGRQPTVDHSACVDCPNNLYKPTGDYNTCLKCPIGATCTPLEFVCTAGYELNNGRTGCNKCIAGQYKSSESNSDKCISCPIGTRSNFARTVCSPCPVNTYRSSLDYNYCISCPVGSNCNAESFECQYGWKLTADGSGCEISDNNDPNALSEQAFITTTINMQWNKEENSSTLFNNPVFYSITGPLAVFLLLISGMGWYKWHMLQKSGEKAKLILKRNLDTAGVTKLDGKLSSLDNMATSTESSSTFFR